ncbi:MAG: hypothetical protein PHV33_06565 [Elusimicrobiales bacterium]|nr:hypothetical protein [Elusimicrobiales bacterium]
MRLIFIAALGLGLTAPAAAAFEDEGLPEAVVSSDTARGEDEEEQPQVQESDEDLAAFVTDYIRKDIQLKGAFFLEEQPSKKILKLELASVEPKASAGESGARAVTVTFKDPAGKKRTALFWLQGGPWGGLDIFKIDLKTPGVKPTPELKPAPAKRKN